MEIVEQKSSSTYVLIDFDDKLNLFTLREAEEKSGLFMGWEHVRSVVVLAIFQTGNTMVIVFVDTPQPITTDALADTSTLQILRKQGPERHLLKPATL